MRSTPAWAMLFAAVGAFAGCRDVVDPVLKSDARQFSPPAVYARWWAMTEACSGISGSLAAVKWFAVPGAETIPLDGQQVEGYWSSHSNRIVLAGQSQSNGGAVRHEMLHALVRALGHARLQFLGRCSGVVDCSAQCVSDAGPVPPISSGATEVAADSLQVGVEVVPSVPTPAIDGGFFSIIVTVRNPAARAVIVRLRTRPYAPAITFSFDVSGPSGGVVGSEVKLDPAVTIFMPGELKRQVFDFVIGNALASPALPPGTYSVRGGYGGKWATHAPVVLAGPP